MGNSMRKERVGRSGRRLVPDRARPGRLFPYFLIAGLIALAVATTTGLLASKRAAEAVAIDEVRELGESFVATVVEPNLTPDLLAGNQQAIAAFDQLIRDQILSDLAIRVRLSAPDGRILYADEPELIGETQGVEVEKAWALLQEQQSAIVAEFDEAGNQLEAQFGRLLQVFVPVETSSGEKLLLEIDSPFESAAASHSRQIWAAFVPIIFGAVLVLGVLHLPLVWDMTRRLQQSQDEREELLGRAIEASNLEDLRIATELHDGVIQDLAANSFNLAAVDGLIQDGDYPEVRDLVHSSASSIRASILALRELIVEIYPPNLRDEGMDSVIEKFLATAAKDGLRTSFETQGFPDLPPELELLAYRTVRESVRNTVKHAAAEHLCIKVSDGTRPFVVEVTDDGKGFSGDEAPESGHFGLRLLSDLARDLGAKLDVVSAPGQGTSVRLEAIL
jgi:signal transduction histidine kinase